MGQHDHDRCAALGADTKSDGVLRDSVAWIGSIEEALRGAHPELAGYKPVRFVFFLECIDTLLRAREAQRVAAGKIEGTSKARQHADRVARQAREELKHVLEQLALGRPEEEDAVARATLEDESPDALAKSIAILAAEGKGWLAQTTPSTVELVKSSALTEGMVTRAEDAAAALTSAAAATATSGGRVWRDGPAVNLAEGHVLTEMRYAHRELERAHEKNPAIGKLVPGPNVRGVLGRQHTPKPAGTNAGGAGTGGGSAGTPDDLAKTAENPALTAAGPTWSGVPVPGGGGRG